VCARQRPEALAVFTETARQRRAPLTIVDISENTHGSDETVEPDAITLPAAEARRLGVPAIRPAMVGQVQRENICQALSVYRLLTDAGRAGTAAPDQVIRALERCRLPGRGEIIGDLFLDGAHTPESVTAVVASYIRRHGRKTRIPVILGVVAGKDVEGIARALAPIAQQIIVSTPGRFKPGDPGNVADRIRAEHGVVELIPDSAAALARAREVRGSESEIPILVTGSFYMGAELRRLVTADR
jgi:dihydrofolate synthase/folylpolyglutamate synthase